MSTDEIYDTPPSFLFNTSHLQFALLTQQEPKASAIDDLLIGRKSIILFSEHLT